MVEIEHESLNPLTASFLIATPLLSDPNIHASFGQAKNMTRTRRVESKKEQEQVVDDFITRGYRIKQQGQYTAKVKEKDWGDVPIHGFLFVFTFVPGAIIFDTVGLPSGGVWIAAVGANLSYAAYSWYSAEEIIIKVSDETIE